MKHTHGQIRLPDFPSRAEHYWPVDIRCISPSVLTDWRLVFRSLCPWRAPVSSLTWLTTEGHLDGQVALLRAPPLGLHTSVVLIHPVIQDHRESQECKVKKVE